jgi:hypothetical protein
MRWGVCVPEALKATKGAHDVKGGAVVREEGRVVVLAGSVAETFDALRERIAALQSERWVGVKQAEKRARQFFCASQCICHDLQPSVVAYGAARDRAVGRSRTFLSGGLWLQRKK